VWSAQHGVQFLSFRRARTVVFRSSCAAQVDTCAYMASGGAVEIDLSPFGAAMVQSLQPALPAQLCITAGLIDDGGHGFNNMSCALAKGVDAAADGWTGSFLRRVYSGATCPLDSEVFLDDHGSIRFSGLSAARCCTTLSTAARCCTSFSLASAECCTTTLASRFRATTTLVSATHLTTIYDCCLSGVIGLEASTTTSAGLT
jgi:hypothetical protein